MLSSCSSITAANAPSQTPSNVKSDIQTTTSCGQGSWDILSVMMMDSTLAANYHMEGLTNGAPSAYMYTIWAPDQSKVYYVKSPQGNPWDVNLYDSNYVYQWVTELQKWNNVNHWNDPKSCRKFNNGSNTASSNNSMRWASRCATPGGTGSSFWNSPSAQPYNTNYYTYVDQMQQPAAQNLAYSQLALASTDTMSITDHRANPPKQFSVTIVPLQYTYSCTVSGNVNSCGSREVFDYGFDTTANPVDNVKHSYGWVRWQFYTNSTGGNPNAPANWTLVNQTVTDHLMQGTVNLDFQCF